MEKMSPTGEIIPRDYGLILRMPKQKRVFISSLRYTLGRLMLYAPNEITELLIDKAQRENIDAEKFIQEFENSVVKKEGAKNVLRLGGRDALQNVIRYGRSVSARVKSKSRTSPAFYEVKIISGFKRAEGLEYRSARCDCKDNSWSDVKNLETICAHAAALEIALYLDNKSRRSSEENLTGLLPKKRINVVSIPFSLFDAKNDSTRLLIDILCDYYINQKSQFEINLTLLNNPKIYTSELIKALESSFDSVQFGVLRQEEKEANNDERLYGAINALKKRVFRALWDRKFINVGYSLEFKGTPYQVVGQRFIHKNSVYTFCTKQGMLPLIVKRNLGEKAENIFNSDEQRTDSPFKRVGQRYLSIDDATRRESLTEIVIPGLREGSITTIPEFLRRMYEREMSK